MFVDQGAVTAFIEASPEAGVTVAILATPADVGLSTAVKFSKQTSRAASEEPESRPAILLGQVCRRLHVTARALDAEHAGAHLIELFPELLF